MWNKGEEHQKIYDTDFLFWLFGYFKTKTPEFKRHVSSRRSMDPIASNPNLPKYLNDVKISTEEVKYLIIVHQIMKVSIDLSNSLMEFYWENDLSGRDTNCDSLSHDDILKFWF